MKNILIKPAYLAFVVGAAVTIYSIQLVNGVFMTKFSSTVKSVCLGRFALDLPREAIITYGGATVSGWRINGVAESDDEFFERVNKAEHEIRVEKDYDGNSVFESMQQIKIGDLHGKIFTYDKTILNRNEDEFHINTEIISAKSVVRMKGISYVLYNATIRRERINQLKEILSKLKTVDQKSILSMPGFCFGEGMMLTALLHKSSLSESSPFPP